MSLTRTTDTCTRKAPLQNIFLLLQKFWNALQTHVNMVTALIISISTDAGVMMATQAGTVTQISMNACPIHALTINA